MHVTPGCICTLFCRHQAQDAWPMQLMRLKTKGDEIIKTIAQDWKQLQVGFMKELDPMLLL